MKNKIYHTVKV